MAGAVALPAAAAPGATPTITYPLGGEVFHGVPTIGGTGEPGSTASITDGNGSSICSVPVGEYGYFSCTGTQLLPAGTSNLTVTTTTLDGTPTVGTTVQVQAKYSIALGNPVAGSLISSTQAFSGTALPGVQVQMVTVAGIPMCTTVSDEWGNYQCIPTVPFSVGPLTLAPSMTVVEGSVVVGDPVAWTVIADPMITSPANGGVVGDLPVFTGTAHPESDIAIVHGRSGAVLCSAKVGTSGNFNCPVTRRLPVGGLEVFPATVTDGGRWVMGAMATFAVEVTPMIVRPANGSIVPAIPTIEGTAGAYSSVAVLDGNGKTLCTVKADENGAFSCVPTEALTSGSHSLLPVQTGFVGDVVRGAAIHVTVPGTAVEETGPTTPAVTTAAVSVVKEANAISDIGATHQLAATGASGLLLPLAVGGGLLLLGSAALVPMFRRRTRS
ncbi:hypothetical protein MB46_02080 [Arthrobacter alpinus]|nr:hypothetical protein MB46_02080 [Arthrobacter alpinus]